MKEVGARNELEIFDDIQRDRLENAWRAMLNTEGGRVILHSVIEKCGCHDFSFYGNSMDTLTRGRQQIGSEILADYVFPFGMEFYTQMLLEAEARDDRRAEIEEKMALETDQE